MTKRMHRYHSRNPPIGLLVVAAILPDFSDVFKILIKLTWSNAQCFEFGIDEMGYCPAVGHSICCGDKGERRNEHFFSRLYTNKLKADMESCCAVNNRHCIPGTGICLNILLEAVNIFPD